ncbi:hypothetical protein DPEC_G00155390 [Dallia pectoralis]|uniref:Uncharacterized protein n=1 Tax=Dallia pectoralis TaxID=75939 RepID=A0ACC2GKD4_DALPE|nr:hypothetical protein DPEC_G00155390 [Dallia pectoralis]
MPADPRDETCCSARCARRSTGSHTDPRRSRESEGPQTAQTPCDTFISINQQPPPTPPAQPGAHTPPDSFRCPAGINQHHLLVSPNDHGETGGIVRLASTVNWLAEAAAVAGGDGDLSNAAGCRGNTLIVSHNEDRVRVTS